MKPMINSAVSALLLSAFCTSALADSASSKFAFPEKIMIRVGAYVIDAADTSFSLNSASGLGTIIDYQRDLGGEDSDTIPRIDAYYRFNERHRIDFTTFRIDRAGSRTLAIDITIEGNDYVIGETINSDIEYTLYRLGYNYSFYHSPKVELSLTAGLNITKYDLAFNDLSGSKSEAAGVTAPLPVFGLRMGYAITPKWSVRYVSESFFVNYEDVIKGALLNFELSTEYKILRNFALGVGFARLSLDVEVNDPDWRGQVSDSYSGYTVFGTFYF